MGIPGPLDDVKKKLAENQEQVAKRDFTLTGAQQYGLAKATKQFQMSVCLPMSVHVPFLGKEHGQ